MVSPGVPNAVYRLYTSRVGPLDQLVFERVYESAADEGKAHAEYGSRPEAAEFWAKFNALVERGGTSEIWHVEEWRWD